MTYDVDWQARNYPLFFHLTRKTDEMKRIRLKERNILCPEAWLPFPLIKKVQCSVFDWAVLNPPTCCLLPYVTPPFLAHGILFTRAETTSPLLSGENSCTLIDETQFFDNIMFHICQTDPAKWYNSGLWVTMFQSVQVKRDSDESQRGKRAL